MLSNMLRVLLFSLLTFSTPIYSTLPPIMPYIIKNHFEQTTGVHLYVCHKRDITTIMRSFLDTSFSFNAHLLSKINSSQDIMFNFKQPQVLGIFLDLTCDEGAVFLNQSSTMFNASYIWLMWSLNINHTQGLLLPTRIATDSKVTLIVPKTNNNIKLFDLFRIHFSLPFTITEIGEFSTTNNTYVTLGLPPKRQDFQGVIIPATIMLTFSYNLSIPFSTLLDKTFLDGYNEIQRYSLSVFLYFPEIFNFTYKYYVANSWGYPTKNGSYSGMIGDLQAGISEIGLSVAAYSRKRTEVVDYLITMYIAKISFAFKQRPSFGAYGSLITPLDAEVWIALFVVILAATVVFRIIASYEKSSTCNKSCDGSIFLVLSALSQQGVPDGSKKLSTRFFCIFILICTYSTALHYNIAILNSLILRGPNAIQNIHQLLASNLMFGVQESPYFHYEMTWNDTLTLKVREKLENIKPPNKIYYYPDEGVDLLREGGFVFYMNTQDLFQIVDKKRFSNADICSLTVIEKYKPLSLGAVMKNNSPYKEIFSRKLITMLETGILKHQLNYWMNPKPHCNWKLNAVRIGMKSMTLAYVIIVLGVFVSMITFILEMLHYKRSFGKKNSRIETFDFSK